MTMSRSLTPEERAGIDEHIRTFLSDELDVPLDQIRPETRIIDDLHGDSMMYLELIEDFKKKYDVKVEISVIGRYLQKHPVHTVEEASRIVCDIIEKGDALLAADAEPGPPAGGRPGATARG
jgi:acyl carrier protein